MTQANRTTPAFFDRPQLADRWKCSISSIKRMELSGELKATRLGRRLVRYSVAQIEAIELSKAMGA